MIKALTNEEFIEKARQIHGNRYDYSHVEYINMHKPVLIGCTVHGWFEQNPTSHIHSKAGCEQCSIVERGIKRRKSKDQFISDAISVHGNKYDYSLSEYEGDKIKLIILCPVHGKFSQKAGKHLSGDGCPYCRNDKISERFLFTKEIFVEKAILKHSGKYRYEKSIYVDSQTKVVITCPIHGDFLQAPAMHLKGQGCSKCKFDKLSLDRTMTTDKFISRAQKIHENYYDYSETIYSGSFDKIKIICPKHGVFYQEPRHHLSGHGCVGCKESQGELKISEILNELGINFIREKSFPGLKGVKKLRYDFYFEYDGEKYVIEFDGQQHQVSVEQWGGDVEFDKRKKYDKIKDDFAKNNGIDLIRIPYNCEDIEVTIIKRVMKGNMEDFNT